MSDVKAAARHKRFVERQKGLIAASETPLRECRNCKEKKPLTEE